MRVSLKIGKRKVAESVRRCIKKAVPALFTYLSIFAMAVPYAAANNRALAANENQLIRTGAPAFTYDANSAVSVLFTEVAENTSATLHFQTENYAPQGCGTGFRVKIQNLKNNESATLTLTLPNHLGHNGAVVKYADGQNLNANTTFSTEASSLAFSGNVITVAGITVGKNSADDRTYYVCLAPTLKISPVFECWIDVDATTARAWWGYENPNAYPVTVALGNDNRFNPASYGGSQPTDFAVGRQRNVFSVVIPKGTNVTWLLNGKSGTASTTSLSKKCAADTVPPTITNIGIYNPTHWGNDYNIYGNMNHYNNGMPVVGGNLQFAADYADDDVLTNVRAYLPGRGFFADSEFTPFPTNNGTWNPVPEQRYAIGWNTKTGTDWRSVPDGTYVFGYQAADKGASAFGGAQNYTNVEVPVIVDNTAPSLAFLSGTPAENGVVYGSFTINASYDDLNGLMNTYCGIHAKGWVFAKSWPAQVQIHAQ